MSKCKSNEIHVFPTCKRNDTYDRSARFYTEENFTGSIWGITTKSYIVSVGNTLPSVSSNTLTLKNLVLNIKGYTFNIDNVDITLDTGTSDTLYACVNIRESGDFVILNGGDEDGEVYGGIEFIWTTGGDPTSLDSTDFIKLGKLSNNEFNYSDESFVRLDDKNIRVRYDKHFTSGDVGETSSTLYELLQSMCLDGGKI